MKPNVIIDFTLGRRRTPLVEGRITAALDNLVLIRGDMAGLTVTALYKNTDGESLSTAASVTLFDGDQSGYVTLTTGDGITALAAESGHVDILVLDAGNNVAVTQATVPLAQ